MRLELISILSFFAMAFEPASIKALSVYTTQKEIDLNPKYKATINLRAAAKKGDVAEMIKFIMSGADINDIEGCEQPRAGRTILVEAIDSGSLEAVKLLLSHGVNIEQISDVPYLLNTLNVRNLPSLSYAIAVDASVEIIELLVQNSKDLNIMDIWDVGWTPYKVAVHYANNEAIKILGKAGAHKK